jgi:DNA helicase-2/ATP-dependent DNA helicase PcrA
MAKQLILAVAGSGKTTRILDTIDDQKRSLVVTYTHENHRNLEAGLVEKFGRLPPHVTVLTYFSFLYRFCVRPFFSYELRDRSFTWKLPAFRPFWKKSHPRHYLTKSRYLYANRAAKLPLEFGATTEIIARLERHFDQFLVDEVQDFASNDFNLLLALTKAELDFSLVGDFFQHTFDTSRDGNTRASLHTSGLDAYVAQFRNEGIDVDQASLDKTYRCSPSVCDFITETIGIPIASHRTEESNVRFVEDQAEALALANEPANVTLFRSDYAKYACNANNWGRCKGVNTYENVCVALNPKTLKHFLDGKMQELPDETRHKLYVACSRARGNLYLFPERFVSTLKTGHQV